MVGRTCGRRGRYLYVHVVTVVANGRLCCGVRIRRGGRPFVGEVFSLDDCVRPQSHIDRGRHILLSCSE